ncbi:hypothetical protein JRQ81_002449, partial [Phrynocephalus forsythii]
HVVVSDWTADVTVPPEKFLLTCNISEEEGASVYWTKNQRWQGNGKDLEITVKEPLDAGIYLCWSNITQELLTNTTIYLMKRDPDGKIAHPVLKRLPGESNKIYFKCTANNYSGRFTCIWNSAIQDTDLWFRIRTGSQTRTQGNVSEEIVCDALVNHSSGARQKMYWASCRKQNSTCHSTEEYQPIEMVLEVFHGFVYENYTHIFLIKNILKPDTSECQVDKDFLTWTPPQTWSTPVSYYGLTYQIKTSGRNEQICEVPSDALLQNGSTLSCYNPRCSHRTCFIRSRDRYNINSAWSDWSQCRSSPPPAGGMQEVSEKQWTRGGAKRKWGLGTSGWWRRKRHPRGPADAYQEVLVLLLSWPGVPGERRGVGAASATAPDVPGTGASGKKIDCSEYQQVQQHPTVCPKIYYPLCGTNGVTYGNKCLLCTKILEGAKIDLAHTGECVDCSQYPQPPKGSPGDCPNASKPVCGTDRKTYEHVCILCAKIRYVQHTQKNHFKTAARHCVLTLQMYAACLKREVVVVKEP